MKNFIFSKATLMTLIIVGMMTLGVVVVSFLYSSPRDETSIGIGFSVLLIGAIFVADGLSNIIRRKLGLIK